MIPQEISLSAILGYTMASMKKEVIIAIVLGLLVGLIITYGIYRVRTTVSHRKNETSIEKLATPAASLQEKTNATITILSPEDGAILENKELQIAGSSTPDAHVILFVNNRDYISSADTTGAFSFEVTLEDGVNILTIHVVDQEGLTATTQRVVVVSSIFSNPAEASESGQATAE